ncbi:hypothetical protein HK105_208584 [Polyrhizophydium stewartii]|uniref:Reverse transcriptase n=1 Tax=Polyrhizophydium stewartii TaxID=2732419 RepID=A0ABR4MXF4_9FUNG
MLHALFNSADAIRAAAVHLEAWAAKWQMSYGVAKCGVMCIRAKAGPPPALDPPVLLHEQAAPFVSEYRYLGAIIDDKLSFKP